MYLFQSITYIGNYSKIFQNFKKDKLTLYFFACPLEFTLQWFQTSVASIVAWATDQVLPSHAMDPNQHLKINQHLLQRHPKSTRRSSRPMKRRRDQAVASIVRG